MEKEYEPLKVEIVWTIDDILERQPEWTKDEAYDFLQSIAKQIYDQSMQAGHDTIDALI